MKTKLMSVLLLVLVCTLPILTTVAQDQESTGQLFAIHEDVVIPSKVADYEKAAKNFAALLAEHNMSSMQYNAASSDDNIYLYISPIENYADLDKMNAGFAELEEKAGKEAFGNVMKQFAGKYHSHRDYIVRMHTDLSYKPEYGNNMADGMNFRHWDFLHIYPGKEAEMEALAREWKALYEHKNISQGYRIYTGALGTDMPLFVVVWSARNATEYYTYSGENMKMLGEEAQELLDRTMAITWKFEHKNGAMRPDLSYIKPQVAQAEN